MSENPMQVGFWRASEPFAPLGLAEWAALEFSPIPVPPEPPEAESIVSVDKNTNCNYIGYRRLTLFTIHVDQQPIRSGSPRSHAHGMGGRGVA
jgi:hypothetical protein